MSQPPPRLAISSGPPDAPPSPPPPFSPPFSPLLPASAPPAAATSVPIGSRKRAQQPADALRCVLPGLKRLRRESPASPTSVGDVADPKAAPPAPMTSAVATAVAATAAPNSAKMQSMLRGLEHVAACGRAGCGNPLCLSTRNFIAKVDAHRTAAAAKPAHIEARCGACQLWIGIVKAHAPGCAVPQCCVPGCREQRRAGAGGLLL